ncbi:MAG: DUF397 domain-containing protein [Acidobacteriaceae bacterium]|nr:DUF397 domain-containing protein [Streptosporangiaceae bacterium]MBV9767269.1 DUF397 domain-containing protein [Acidobacteriaceae bacterium]
MKWRKSSYSGQSGGNCVEVGQSGKGAILVRDTKDNGRGPTHRFTADAWRAFVARVKG